MMRLRSRAGRDQQLAGAVSKALVDTLFASPASLAIGAVAGSAGGAAIAYRVGSPLFLTISVAISLLGALRIANHAIYRDLSREDLPAWMPSWEHLYEAGAWAYASLLGLLAFCSLYFTDDAVSQLLSATSAIAYAAGISGRNAGRPKMAILQEVLAAGPLFLGLVLSGDPYKFLLGITVALSVLSTADITLKTYDVVLKAFTATHEKGLLADRFRELARTDALTGLDNRTTFQQRLEEELAALTPGGGKLAIVWLDLDRFKEVNDTLGHPVGDQLLIEISARLSALTEGRGWIARYGGDEFVMLFPSGDRAEAEQFVYEVLASLARPVAIDGNVLEVSGSLGAAIAPDDGGSAELIMQRADMALYHAKGNGRNRFCFFEADMNARLLDRRELEAGLRHAIERGEFQVYYQPVIDLASERIVSCEALLRWFHAERGFVSPAEFIPIAETAGLIDEITEWVLREATATAMRWRPDITVAVNISPVQLRNPRLPTVIVQALAQSGLPAHRLELEITESVFINENEQTKAMLRELQRIGLRLALDDFGTGYSSLAYLLKYTFNKIKIDGSFVANLESSRAARAIIEAVVSLADRLDMETVAEGVETAEQVADVRTAGCQLAQGYHFARPMPSKDLDDRLAQSAKPKRAARPARAIQGRAAAG